MQAKILRHNSRNANFNNPQVTKNITVYSSDGSYKLVQARIEKRKENKDKLSNHNHLKNSYGDISGNFEDPYYSSD